MPEPSTDEMTSAELPLLVRELDAATRDLRMPSETDAPIVVFHWPEISTFSPATVAQQFEIDETQPLEERTLDEMFGDLAIEEEWMDDEARANAERFAELLQTLEKLENPRVYLFGERRKNVVVVGRLPDAGVAGVTTSVVET